MKKTLITIGVAILLIGGLVAAVTLKPLGSGSPSPDGTTATQNETPSATDVPLQSGRYTDYAPSLVSDAGYTDTILFFHAPWCPECRAFEQAILEANIPDGVQILKVDYDSSSDLKSKYGVTLQSTFVKVDQDGDKISLWVGYGKQKSIDLILEMT